jgi:hypothetical protein
MLALYLLTASFFVQEQPKPLPELKQFLDELRKTLHTDGLLLSQYTYTDKLTEIELDSKGKAKKTEVSAFQVFPGSPEHVGYRRQIVRNGKPLSPEESKKEEEALQKRIADAERRRSQISPAQREQNRATRLRREQQIIDDALGVFDVEEAGRENIDGRPAILLKFQPGQKYKPKTFEGKSMQHVAGKAWIDEQDHQVVRVEIEVIDSISIGLGLLAKLEKGASIVSERRKINDEIWLPVKTDVTLNAKVLLLKGFNMRQINEYSDHKKYTVDTVLKFGDIDDPQR